MSLPVEPLEILAYQIAVFLALSQLCNSLLYLVLLLADPLVIAVSHPVLFIAVPLALLFQCHQPSRNVLKPFLLLGGKCLNLLHIRQISRHKPVLARQQICLPRCLGDLLQTVCDIAAALLFVLEVDILPVIDDVLPVLLRLLLFLLFPSE